MAVRAAVYVILRQSRGVDLTRSSVSNAFPGVQQCLKGLENRVLMMRRQGGWAAGWWSLPAGHIEVKDNETPAAAASRELMEEVGLELDEADLDVVHLTYRQPAGARDHTYIDLFLEARGDWRGTPANKEPAKCDRLEFMDIGQLPGNTLPHVRQALELWAGTEQALTYSCLKDDTL
eukprot:m.456168 g.456168  ORF g.456168 m.456168 type:complete len:177 (+) comp21002_c0_seq1:94-624(+)